MRIVLAGIIGRYPWGGVTWCSLMYLLGLRLLGHEIFYLEDTCECNFDPEQNSVATEPDYALRHINETLEVHGLEDSWCYVDYRGKHHGKTLEEMQAICAGADVLLVLSGGCWIWRDHYLKIPMKAFIDSDPAFTQIAIANARKAMKSDPGKRWYVDFFSVYDRHFTFGANIAAGTSEVPDDGFKWQHTWQPVETNAFWAPQHWNRDVQERLIPGVKLMPLRGVWSTVMTWQIKSFADIGGNKDVEFLKVIDLPKRTKVSFELAVNGPRELLESHGWRCVDAMAMSLDPFDYRRFIAGSRAEFSVAKHTYVATRSGWFSDRTECYLACGLPAVVQDTGFSAHLPCGEGLLPWSTAEEALDAIERVEKDYERHSRKAREVALDHFRSETVLRELLNRL
jgi:hypothetical protein